MLKGGGGEEEEEEEKKMCVYRAYGLSPRLKMITIWCIVIKCLLYYILCHI